GLRGLREADAVLGRSADGGYWAIGLREPDARAFAGVPMSVPQTGAVQRARLRALGLSIAELPPLVDVDTIADAHAVAAAAPDTIFARALAGAELHARVDGRRLALPVERRTVGGRWCALLR